MKTGFNAKVLFLGAALCALGFIAGCSTWSAEKCQGTNWDTQGYADGSVGKNSAGGTYASQCLKKKISIDGKAYDRGYQRGLTSYCNFNKGYQTAFGGAGKEAICSAISPYNQGYAKGTQEFCTAENGYKVALDGGEEAKICSGGGLTSFMNGYRKGRKKFVLEEIENVKTDLDKASEDLDDVRDKLADKQRQLDRVPRNTYEAEVVRLRQELEAEVNDLMRTRDEIKGQVDQMKDRLVQLERESKLK